MKSRARLLIVSTRVYWIGRGCEGLIALRVEIEIIVSLCCRESFVEVLGAEERRYDRRRECE